MPLTFAYGSNMDFDQMLERCKSAKFVCVAKLYDHRLEFTRYSDKREGGVADVLPEEGVHIWGVVYRISDADLRILDKREGVLINAYVRSSGKVYENGDEAKPIEVEIYRAIPQDKSPYLPSKKYKNHIVSGAKHWDLPADYIAEREKIQVAS